MLVDFANELKDFKIGFFFFFKDKIGFLYFPIYHPHFTKYEKLYIFFFNTLLFTLLFLFFDKINPTTYFAFFKENKVLTLRAWSGAKKTDLKSKRF